MKHTLPFIFLAASLFPVQAGAAGISRTSAVNFNTVCANCHEGECSGRLSFTSGVAATQGHILRHLPASSPLQVEELFTILKYTKEHCAQYPLPDAAPANGVWNAEALQQWRSPEGKGYFIPLGKMRRGIYRLELRFDGKPEAGIRITNDKFDVLLEEQQCKDHDFNHILPVTTDGLYFLHLKSSASLLGLTLFTDKQIAHE